MSTDKACRRQESVEEPPGWRRYRESDEEPPGWRQYRESDEVPPGWRQYRESDGKPPGWRRYRESDEKPPGWRRCRIKKAAEEEKLRAAWACRAQPCLTVLLIALFHGFVKRAIPWFCLARYSMLVPSISWRALVVRPNTVSGSPSAEMVQSRPLLS